MKCIGVCSAVGEVNCYLDGIADEGEVNRCLAGVVSKAVGNTTVLEL